MFGRPPQGSYESHRQIDCLATPAGCLYCQYLRQTDYLSAPAGSLCCQYLRQTDCLSAPADCLCCQYHRQTDCLSTRAGCLYCQYHRQAVSLLLQAVCIVSITDRLSLYSCRLSVLFSPILWYPIGSYSLVSLLQLPYGFGRGEGRDPCVLWNKTRQAALLLDTMLA